MTSLQKKFIQVWEVDNPSCNMETFTHLMQLGFISIKQIEIYLIRRDYEKMKDCCKPIEAIERISESYNVSRPKVEKIVYNYGQYKD